MLVLLSRTRDHFFLEYLSKLIDSKRENIESIIILVLLVINSLNTLLLAF